MHKVRKLDLEVRLEREELLSDKPVVDNGLMATRRKKKSVYLAPEMVPHVVCGALLNAAFQRDTEAKKLYEQVKAD